MIKRTITDSVVEAARHFPVVAVVGPRQSGKTTLTQQVFPDHKYVSLEDFDKRELANTDPRLFLAKHPSAAGLIIDEIQYAPQLLSYMQTIVDREKKKGFFILTGSQNFLVNEAITQTLAGRIAILTLLPLSISELKAANLLPSSVESCVFRGFYPQIYAEQTSPELLYKNYTHTYIERDVREIKNVTDLNLFQRFLRLCAGRIGQIVNLTSLGNDCGINYNTVRAWLSVLEASYVIVQLQPYFNNFGKRLIKSPKIYFIDTGLACWLLNITNEEELTQHYLRGGLVESFVVADLFKQYYNKDKQPRLYFWRDKTGHEIDCLIDKLPHPTAIEIKSGKTVRQDFFKEFSFWNEASSAPADTKNYVVYGGDEDQHWPQVTVLKWHNIDSLSE